MIDKDIEKMQTALWAIVEIYREFFPVLNNGERVSLRAAATIIFERQSIIFDNINEIREARGERRFINLIDMDYELRLKNCPVESQAACLEDYCSGENCPALREVS